MKIQQFIERSVNLEPIEQTIQKVWQNFKTKHRWANRPTKIPRDVLHAAIRGQQRVDEEGAEDLAGYNLEDNLTKIASQWNWKKSPAPLQLIQSQKLWDGIVNNLQIGMTEKAEGTKETLESAQRWSKNQVLARRLEWANIQGEAGRSIRNRILKETKEAAHALGKLEDLTASQKAIWEEHLRNLIGDL